MADILTKAVLLFSLVIFGFMAKVGNDGGKIRHPEITNGTVYTQPPEQDLQEHSEESDD